MTKVDTSAREAVSKPNLAGASSQLSVMLKAILGDQANDPVAIAHFSRQLINLGAAQLMATAPNQLADVGAQLLAMSPKVVFSIPGYEYLAQQLVATSGGKLELGREQRKRHKDGKGWQRYVTSLKGREVILVGSTMSDTDQMEMYKLGCNARLWKARKLTFVITYHGDARQERAQVEGESIDGLFTSVQLAKVPQCPDGNEVLLVDIHDNTITGFFLGAGVNCRNIDVLPRLIETIGMQRFGGKKCLPTAPDAGRGKVVSKAAKSLGWEFAIASKFRSGATTETAGLIGNVRGRNVILADDIGNSLGSAIGAGQFLKKKRAREVVLVITHGAIPDAKYVREFMDTGIFSALYVTDSL